ncbi:MAG: hypothetical protein IPL49_09655 [Saprospirales bacterium]|nr:hypothetical protein [Saprospirales bacterium]
MEKKLQIALRLEFIWLLFTLLVFASLAAPIYVKFSAFPFYWTNFLFVWVFITASRYIFLLPTTFLARKQVLKIFFFFASIPSVFYLIGEIHGFQTFLDEEGIQTLMPGLSLTDISQFGGYVKAEILFFGVGSVIAVIIFAFRMLLSVWRLHNRGTI